MGVSVHFGMDQVVGGETCKCGNGEGGSMYLLFSEQIAG